MAYTDVTYDVADGGVATLTLNRPERMNAVRYETYRDIRAALDEAQADDAVRCLVVTGAGRGFCAGDDFQGIFLAENRDQARFDRRINRIKGSGVQDAVEGFFQFEKPCIAAVNGPAVGMGMDLAILCDIRYASENARFGSYFVRRGVVGSTGGTYLLKFQVGLSKAMELLLTGDLIDAREAERIGLVSKVCAPGSLMAETYALARRLAAGAPLAQRAIKRVVRKGFDTDWRTLDEYSMSLSDVLWETDDHMEGVNSFVEKRDPHYQGR
ncbi:MAG: enoyl-CoA hydratase/isomerase family protein [Dehalococcoidia bacterium]